MFVKAVMQARSRSLLVLLVAALLALGSGRGTAVLLAWSSRWQRAESG